MDGKKQRHALSFANLFRILSILLIVLAILLSLLIGSVMWTAIQRKVQDERYETYGAYLGSISGSMENTMDQLMQLTSYFSKEASMIQISLTERVSDSIVNSALHELPSFRASNSLISEAAVCARRYDRVYHDNYTYTTMENSPLHAMITGYLNKSVNAVRMEYNTHTYSLFHDRGRLILACDYPLTENAASATIFVILNKDRLYRQIQSSLVKDGEIWVYGPEGEPLFADQADYPEWEREIGASLSAGDAPLVWKDRILFNHTSPQLGWRFVYAIPMAFFSTPFSDVLMAALPIVAVILAVMLFLSYLITRYIHRPYKELIESVMQEHPTSSGEPKRLLNGMNFLTRRFRDMSSSQTELTNMLENVSGDVLSRVFIDIMAGRPQKEENISTVLNSIHSFFQPNAHYVASILYFEREFTRDELHRKIIPIINNVLEQAKGLSDMLAHPMVMDGQTVLIVLSFPMEEALLNIRRQFLLLKNQLVSRLSGKGWRCVYERGHIYHNILDLRFSYEEARDALRRPEQPGSDETDAAVQPAPAENTVEKEDGTPAERAGQLLQLIRDDSLDQAQELGVRLLEQIDREAGDADSAQEAYRQLFNAVSDELAKAPYMDSNSFPDDLLEAPETDASLPLPDRKPDLLKQAGEKMNMLLTETDRKERGLHHRLLIAAQEVISCRYSEGTLSLSDVAEEVGANASYLSKLFTSNLGIKFTDYVNQFRVRQSLKLLTETDISVKEIAEKTGFNSAQQYIRVFRKYEDTSPGQYRTTAGLGQEEKS